MLEEQAQVVSVAGTRAKVAMVRSDACGECAAKDMCHSTSENTMEMEVDNPAGAHPGDRVIISLSARDLLKATTMIYMFPAFVMVAGASVGWFKTGTDIGAMAGAAIGFTVSFLFLFFYSRRGSNEGAPKITKVL